MSWTLRCFPSFLLCLFTLLHSPHSLGLTIDPQKTNAALYRRYVRPQLRTINRDFYGMLKKYPGVSTFLRLQTKLSRMDEMWISTKKQCRDYINQKCQEQWDEFFEHISKMESTLFAIMLSEDIYEGHTFFHIKRKYLGEIYIQLEKISSQVKFCTTAIILREDSDRCSTLDLSREFNNLHALYQHTLMAFLPIKGRSFFEVIYTQFILVIEKKILANDDRHYLYNNLEKFNMMWNQFNFTMTKRGLDVGKSFEGSLNMMHRRWNSILKIVLKRENT